MEVSQCKLAAYSKTVSEESISNILKYIVPRRDQKMTAAATYKGAAGGEGVQPLWAADSKGQQSGQENEYF